MSVLVKTNDWRGLLPYLSAPEKKKAINLLESLTGIRSDYDLFRAYYWDKPEKFIAECIQWLGEAPASYQCDIAARLPERRRVSVRGPHGPGKTALAAWLVHWFALTRDGLDWKVVTTASAWRQLTHYLWPEIHKWARRLNWRLIGRKPYRDTKEILTLSLKLSTGEAFAVSSDVPDLIEGAHADHILYVFDEAKTIMDDTWDAAEGALTNENALAFSISTPGEMRGRFYQIQNRQPGYEDWWIRKITKEEAIAAGRMSAQWVEQRKKQWGEKSAVYLNRVEGEFAAHTAEGIIPLAWAEAAMARWHEWNEAGKPGDLKRVGVDVAWEGEDESVLAPMYEWGKNGERWFVIDDLRIFSKESPMETVGRVQAIQSQNGCRAIVDVIGIGAGVYDRLREQEADVEAFNAAESTTMRDKSGEWGFANKRAWGWWNLREMLEPDNGIVVALPPDDKLLGELVAPRVRPTSGGRLQVESKDDLRKPKRLGRSTDRADAVIMALLEMEERVMWGLV